MFENPENARKVILASLKYLQTVKKARPGLLILQVICDTKGKN